MKRQVQEPVGLILKCPEGLQVKRQGTILDVEKLFRLGVGDRLIVPKSGGAELIHTPSGKCYRLEPGQSAVVAPNGVWLTAQPARRGPAKPPTQARVLRVYPAALLPKASAPAQRIMGGISRGVELEQPLRQPRPYGAVDRNENLTLRWTNTLTAEQLRGRGLELTLRSELEREPLLVVNLPGKASAFAVPAEKLQEGVLYTWEVAAGRQRVEGTFWVLTAAELRSAMAARSEASGATGVFPKDPVPFLVLAEQLQALGLLFEALAALKEAQKRDAANSLTKAAIEDLERLLPL